MTVHKKFVFVLTLRKQTPSMTLADHIFICAHTGGARCLVFTTKCSLFVRPFSYFGMAMYTKTVLVCLKYPCFQGQCFSFVRYRKKQIFCIFDKNNTSRAACWKCLVSFAPENCRRRWRDYASSGAVDDQRCLERRRAGLELLSNWHRLWSLGRFQRQLGRLCQAVITNPPNRHGRPCLRGGACHYWGMVRPSLSTGFWKLFSTEINLRWSDQHIFTWWTWRMQLTKYVIDVWKSYCCIGRVLALMCAVMGSRW